MKFDQYLNGMVELRLQPQETERVLQQITAAGIPLYQVRRQEDGLYVWILLDDFPTLQRLLRQEGRSFHIQGRRGFPFVLRQIKRRRGLWMGALLCFAVVYLLLSFLWDYEVIGNQQYSDAHMIALVQEYGILPGSRSDKFDYDALQRQIVLEHLEFAWIHLKPNGTTLTITVKERLPDEKQQKIDGSMIAAADGVITELLVFRGTPLVKRGDWVKEGQVMIGGWDYPDRERDSNGEFAPSGMPFSVRAKGVVRGQRERSAIGSCGLEEQMLQSTGNVAKQVALVWNGHTVVLSGPKESPYLYSCQQFQLKSLWEWKGIRLPVYIKTTTFEEKKVERRIYTQEEAYTMAVERARKRLQQQMPSGSQFIRERSGLCPAQGETVVQAEVVWTVEEDLVQMQQAQLPKAETTERQSEEKTAGR